MLSAGRGRPRRAPFGFLVWALPVVVAAKRGVCCLSIVGPRICWRVGGTRDISVEALSPQGRESFELGSTSGWSRVLGIDAVGSPPHCDLADEGGAQVGFRCSPGWLRVTVASVVLDLVGEVCDQLGSLRQVGPPDGMGLEPFWNAPEPRQRPWVGRREGSEAPVEDGGHVACGREAASAGGLL